MSGESKLINLLGEANDPSRRGKKGKASKSNKSAPLNAAASKKNNATSTKSKYLQMSHKWIFDRFRKDFPQIETDITSGLDNKNYSRHVFLVTPIKADEHIIAVN